MGGPRRKLRDALAAHPDSTQHSVDQESHPGYSWPDNWRADEGGDLTLLRDEASQDRRWRMMGKR